MIHKNFRFAILVFLPNMKKLFLLLSVLYLSCWSVTAQENYFPDEILDSAKAVKSHFRVAIFAPLYLDSVFSTGATNVSNTVPRFILPAVEFMQGANLAIDTIRLNGKTAEAFLYDSKSAKKPISWLVNNHMLDSIDLIIGSVKDNDYLELAYYSHINGTPFVSATFPNDGGVINTPGLIIVNSTLKAHCEGILSYLTQKHGTDKIYMVKQKDDNRIENYFKEINVLDGKPRLNINILNVDSSVSSAWLKRRIDTTVASVIIGGTLREAFARNITDACYAINKNHPVTLIGMPNWDGFRSLLQGDEFLGFPILYTTPHYDGISNSFNELLTKKYFQLYRAKPSDMAYKGFELSYYFINLLLNHPNDFLANINNKRYAAFHDFLFKPVYIDPANTAGPDYYENKHLYIMHILNGEIGRQW